MTDDLLPGFTFTPEEIANIKASVGAVDVDESQPTPISEIRPKRRPGRPRKNAVQVEEEGPREQLSDIAPPAKLTKREEREVAERLANILTGATGMAGMVKPYLPMTDEEAKAIAEPLASYLIRNESTSGIAREILENYDLVAMTLGVGSYAVRVYSDRREEVRSKRPPNTEAIQRISELPPRIDERGSDEESRPLVSVPNASIGGTIPFDV